MNSWTGKMNKKWIEVTSKWIGLKAIESNPEGLKEASVMLINWMEQIGFEIETYVNEDAPYRPVIVAKKPPKGDKGWIGFFQHYDVEPANPADWSTDPWTAVISDSKLIGRGIADNIGPFTQRLICIENDLPNVGLLFVIQGEEEIGSPWPHELYPSLNLPEVKFWIDETGYFFKNGNQRILYLGDCEILNRVNEKITQLNNSLGLETHIRHRFMSKAFGVNSCPCIVHLLDEKPYIALGPNDDTIKVHGIDEALDMELLPLSAVHLGIIFEEAGS